MDTRNEAVPAGRQGFTLIEIVVVMGITLSLMVAIGGVMTSSFRLKNSSDILENVQNESQVILNELKKNIFDSNVDTILCSSSVGSSISFETKNGGNTTLKCDLEVSKVASVSAESGTYWLNNDNMPVQNCNNFVMCDYDSDQNVTNVTFNVKIDNYDFTSKVVPR